MSLAGTSFVPAKKDVIHYHSSDSLLITADLYFSSDSLPFVILIHEQGSSRGEYNSIVNRFQKMNFNCLVPDVRNGGNSNYTANETAKRCRSLQYKNTYNEVEMDILSSIAYAFSLSSKPVILVGAGANGALALKITKDTEHVLGAIALSPGEYFGRDLNIETEIAEIQKPILLTASKKEFRYVNQMVSGIDESYKNVFAPESDEGGRGVNALLSENPSNGDYWLSILLFIKDLY